MMVAIKAVQRLKATYHEVTWSFVHGRGNKKRKWTKEISDDFNYLIITQNLLF